MPFGMELHVMRGSLVETPTLRRNDQGEPYCYFRIAVDLPRKAKADGTRDSAKFFDCSASKTYATLICTKAQKGDMVEFRATTKQSSRTVEKDNMKIIYNDISFVVLGDIQFFPKVAAQAKAHDNADATPRQEADKMAKGDMSPEPPHEPMEDAPYDFLSTAEARVVSQLPF